MQADPPRAIHPQPTPLGATELRARAAEAHARLAACDLCALECGHDRRSGPGAPCRLGTAAFWFNECLHYGYEFDFIPAHVIYLTGCNLRCTYCNVMDWIRQPAAGHAWDTALLAQRVTQRRRESARTLLFVGGEPTVNLPAILDLLAAAPDAPPVVWDSNLLFSPSGRVLLKDVVGTYIGDYKFGNDACAERSGALPHYLNRLHENLHFARATARLVVRHLLLPGHHACCFVPMVTWLQEQMPTVELSLRAGYMPPQHAVHNRAWQGTIPPALYEQARDFARAAGLHLID